MKNLKSLTLAIVGTAAAFGLTACGDDVTTEQIYNTVANVGSVDTKKDLPECNEDLSGQTAYVKNPGSFFGCDGENWLQLGGNTVSVGENVCYSEELKDKDVTGYEIFCNGKSIGKVYNGADGKDGKDGDNGKDGVDGSAGSKGDPGSAGSNGKDGKDGEDGKDCEIAGRDTMKVQIACGSETFTMDLSGLVTISECKADDKDCAEPQGDVQVNGQSQKGPFVVGTDVSAYELLDGKTLKQTGNMFAGKIEREDGLFNIKTVKLSSQYAYLSADGFYRNEVTGKVSSTTIKLRALANLKRKNTANINLITHLEYNRAQDLVTGKSAMKVMDAKKQAEEEIFKAFHIDPTIIKASEYAEDFNILSNKGSGNGALLAISMMLQGDRTEAQLTAALASFSVDISQDGKWDNEELKAEIADWTMQKEMSKNGFASIKKNIENWKIENTIVPEFEGYAHNFWVTELGFAECSDKNVGTIAAVHNKYSSFYAAKDSAYTEGDSSLTRFICTADGESYAWREANDKEKDIAALDPAAAGAIEAGKINKNFVYVYDNGEWRRGTNLDKTLPFSCNATTKNYTNYNLVKQDTVWYICDANDEKIGEELIPLSWRTATEAEGDTAMFTATAAGTVKLGHMNKAHVFVYENNTWRRGTDADYLLDMGCLASMDGKVEQNGKNYYTCVKENYLENGAKVASHWRASNADEADTYGWSAPEDGDGSMRPGNIDQNRIYIYDNNQWRKALQKETQLEMGCTAANAAKSIIVKYENTIYTCASGKKTEGTTTVENYWRASTADEADNFGWTASTDGDVRLGNIDSNRVYVYDGTAWRRGISLDKKAGIGCTKTMTEKLNLAKIDSKYYTCISGEKKEGSITVASYWRLSTVEEADTAGAPLEKGTFAWRGSVNSNNIYVYSNETWRVGTALDIDEGLGPCYKEGLVNQMKDSSGTRGWYRCSADAKTATVPMAWRKASDFEADTSGMEIPKTNDAAWGRKNTSWAYVYDTYAGHWRLAIDTVCNIYGKCNVELSTLHMDSQLGPCTKLRNNTMKKSSENIWYSCELNKAASSFNQDSLHLYVWRQSDELTQNTKGLECRYDGEFRRGLVDKDKFFYCSKSGTTVKWHDGSAFADTVGLTQVGEGNAFLSRSGKWWGSLPAVGGAAATGWTEVPTNGTFMNAYNATIDKYIEAPLSENSPDTVIITKAKLGNIAYDYTDGQVIPPPTSAYPYYGYYDEEDLTFYEFMPDQVALGLGPCTKKMATKEGYAKDVPPTKIYPKGKIAQSGGYNYVCKFEKGTSKWVLASLVRKNTYQEYADTSTHDKRREAHIINGKAYYLDADTFRIETASEEWARKYALSEVPMQNATKAFRCAAEDEGKSVMLKNKSVFLCQNGLYKWSGNAIKRSNTLKLYSSSDDYGLTDWKNNYGDVVTIGTRTWTTHNLKASKTSTISPYEVMDKGTALNQYSGSMFTPSTAFSACYDLRDNSSNLWYGVPSTEDYKALFTVYAPNFRTIQSALSVGSYIWDPNYIGVGTNEYLFNLLPTGKVVEEKQSSSYTGYLGYENSYGTKTIYKNSSGNSYRFVHDRTVAILVTSDASTNGFFYYDVAKGGIQAPLKNVPAGAVRCMLSDAKDPPTRN